MTQHDGRRTGADEPQDGPGQGPFNAWLRQQLKARQLTQRQLAQRSGVDHSTISRLVREKGSPTLETVALLARGLGLSSREMDVDDPSIGRPRRRIADVEYALRCDDVLNESEIGEVMSFYLARRRGQALPVTPAPRKRPPPIVVQVSPVRSRRPHDGKHRRAS
jgi:transcriptional regulator with XRE-family HTH domain